MDFAILMNAGGPRKRPSIAFCVCRNLLVAVSTAAAIQSHINERFFGPTILGTLLEEESCGTKRAFATVVPRQPRVRRGSLELIKSLGFLDVSIARFWL